MSALELHSGNFIIRFEENIEGGIGYAVYRSSKPSPICLYRTKRPLILILKDYAAKAVDYEAAYASVRADGGRVRAEGELRTSQGSAFRFEDTIEARKDASAFTFSRKVFVARAEKDDLGFGTRISLGLLQSNDPKDYYYFAPGAWYKQNEKVPDHAIGADLGQRYFWYRETRYALPLFAMQNILNGEAVAFCRAKADVRASDVYERMFDCRTDPSFNYGSLGMSAQAGLSMDYVYPGTEGYNELMTPYRGGPYQYQFGFNRRYHPVEAGFLQDYSIILRFSRNDDFYDVMKDVWRYFYGVFQPKIARVNNEKLYVVTMEMLAELCRDYHGSWGVPFKCLLPRGEIGIVDYQFGFIGQQPNIGYQLLRYGYSRNRPEIAEKGSKVLDFWVHNSLTEWGAPKTWYDPFPPGFLDHPIWLRMIGDGMEGILDGYVFLHSQAVDKPEWLEYCRKVGDWLARSISPEGFWHRAYNFDGSVRLVSPGNTTNVIRFLVQLSLVTGSVEYRAVALKAGDWSYENIYRKMMYVGGTCDNADVLDKESGIYAFFAFLSLYDLTGEEKWLKAARGAADYIETWTYSWAFPVKPIEKVHALRHVDMSGQSLIATGHSGADVYMAACSYIFYRLYLITGDRHYRDFAQFVHKNPKQVTDVDGSLGYGRRGLCEEGADLSLFDSRGVYAWLPWCSYVQIDPVQRLYDTFGVYEIEDADNLPVEELKKRNRIYDTYFR